MKVLPASHLDGSIFIHAELQQHALNQAHPMLSDMQAHTLNANFLASAAAPSSAFPVQVSGNCVLIFPSARKPVSSLTKQGSLVNTYRTRV